MRNRDSGTDPSGAIFDACSPELLGLVDADPPEAFDAITRLALRLFWGVGCLDIDRAGGEGSAVFRKSARTC